MHKDQDDRFWSKVDKTDTCWLWTRGKSNGYGRFRTPAGFIYLAHRYAWLQEHGTEVPSELDHLCRIRHCVNPSHLEAVSHAENIKRGEWHGKPSTHCRRGHPRTAENTRIRTRGTRECRICAGLVGY